MNNTLSKIVIFTAGAAIGSVVAWKLTKTKYERINREDVRQVKELYFSEKCEKEYEDNEDDEEDAMQTEYKDILKDAGYSNYRKENLNEEEEDDTMEPYVISPEEFDEIGYETISLYYFEDGVVTNAITDEIIEDYEELIGDDFVEHFGEYEADSVFIRNDLIQTDFEILRDGGRFSEVR